MIIGNGSDILIFNASTGEPIGCQRNVTVTLNSDMIDVTCKEDAGYAAYISGKRSAEFVCDALVDWQPLSGEGISELVDAYENRTLLSINIADPTETDIYFNGDCYIASIEQNAPMEDVVTYTATLTVTGQIISLVS
jgi:predicted secreted protein